ncbi:hypothetical protein ACROYT_G003769 [Oculina patagonica]
MNSSWYLSNNSNLSMQGIIKSSGGLGEKEENKTSSTGVFFIPAAAYVVLFIASLLGNSVIIHIIQKDNSMKNTTNYLILNQACADLYRTLMELIHISHHLITNRWFGGVLGQITCKLFLVNLFIPFIVSVWILATIAVDRFYALFCTSLYATNFGHVRYQEKEQVRINDKLKP